MADEYVGLLERTEEVSGEYQLLFNVNDVECDAVANRLRFAVQFPCQ
jgi:hypothetical protein